MLRAEEMCSKCMFFLNILCSKCMSSTIMWKQLSLKANDIFIMMCIVARWQLVPASLLAVEVWMVSRLADVHKIWFAVTTCLWHTQRQWEVLRFNAKYHCQASACGPLLAVYATSSGSSAVCSTSTFLAGYLLRRVALAAWCFELICAIFGAHLVDIQESRPLPIPTF